MHIAHPHGCLGSLIPRLFEDLFKVDSSQGTAETGNGYGHQSHTQIHSLLGIFCFVFCFAFTQDHNGYTAGDSHQTDPLASRVRSLQHNDRDHRCGDQLALIRDLKNGCRQVGECHIEQCILYQVQERRDRDFEGIQGSGQDVRLDAFHEFPLSRVDFQTTGQNEFDQLANEN